jgi:hypothetical protein
MVTLAVTHGAFRGAAVGEAVPFRALRDICSTVDKVFCLLERAARAFCDDDDDAVPPGQRDAAAWEAFLACNVVPELGAWGFVVDVDDMAGLAAAGAIGPPTVVLELPLDNAVPQWRTSLRHLQAHMRAAGMGADAGVPSLLVPRGLPWRITRDPDSVTLPPPPARLGGPLPRRHDDLCGAFPCVMCTDPTAQAAWSLLARIPAAAERRAWDVRLNRHGEAMHLAVMGAKLPLAHVPSDGGGVPDTTPVCAAALSAWLSDGTRDPRPLLRVQEMDLRYSPDGLRGVRAVYVVDRPSATAGKDAQLVALAPFYFNLELPDGGVVRVKHELLFCDCMASYKILVAALRDAAAGRDPLDEAAGDLEAYFAAVLGSYRHCTHTLRVQGELLATHTRYKTPLEKLRCLARRSACCDDNSCGRNHIVVPYLPLLLANGEPEDAVVFSLFAAQVGGRPVVAVRDEQDCVGMLAQAHNKLHVARCHSRDCADGYECEHAQYFADHSRQAGFDFPAMLRDRASLLHEFKRGHDGGGAAPAAAEREENPLRDEHDDEDMPVSKTPIPRVLPSDIVCNMRAIEAGGAAWRAGGEHRGAGPFFEFTDAGVVLWDPCCTVPGCGAVLDHRNMPRTSAMLHTTFVGLWRWWRSACGGCFFS